MTARFEQNQGNHPEYQVNPLAELQLTAAEVEAVANAMSVIDAQRAEAIDSGVQLEQVAAGVLPGQTGKTLIAVDRTTLPTPGMARYYVRTTPLDEQPADGRPAGTQVMTEVKDITQTRRDAGRQTDIPCRLGTLRLLRHMASPWSMAGRRADEFGQVTSIFATVDYSIPPEIDTYSARRKYLEELGVWSDRHEENLAPLRGEPFQRQRRATALEEIFAPITPGDKIVIARSALRALLHDVDVPVGASFAHHLKHIEVALGSSELDDAGRERLLQLGATVVEAIKASPENAARSRTIADPELAQVMATAEDRARGETPEVKPTLGFIKGRGYQRAAQARQDAIDEAAELAGLDYQHSLAHPQAPPEPN